MKKVYICRDEWWPVFLLEEGDDYEIPDGLLERYQTVLHDFDAVQDELKAIWRADRKST